MNHAIEWLHTQLSGAGLNPFLVELISRTLIFACVALAAVAANFVARRVILRAVKAFIARTPTDWDDYFLEHQVFDRLSHLAPAMVLHMSAPLLFPASEQAQAMVQRAAVAYMFAMAVMVVDGFLNALTAIYNTFEVSRQRPIKSYVQVVKLVVYLISAILVISALTGRSPWGLLSGLGALTAILMLVFKDSILGLVASIQVTAHDMVRPGDWIEMPKYGADGDVIEVTLNTVKIRNFDKTVSTIPTYALVSETFKNWRGMSESGGRRIKRALWLDQTSVKFCSEAMLDRYASIELLQDYVAGRRAELAEHNAKLGANAEEPVNGRRLTNLGTFRNYVVAYLKQHPKIHQQMTLLVRQLPPGPTGIGIELYCFSNDQNWGRYEDIQADIFDHLLAALPSFELRVFQNPSGAELAALAGAGRK
ncbi:MAG: mechanosensitive ion channel family protein [Myxococcales bacterium]|nr:mechanosensitive ion channel family protein [Myxococcales bacterium]